MTEIIRPEDCKIAFCPIRMIHPELLVHLSTFDYDYTIKGGIDPLVMVVWHKVGHFGETVFYYNDDIDEETLEAGEFQPVAFAFLVAPTDEVCYVRFCPHPATYESFKYLLGAIVDTVVACSDRLKQIKLITINGELVELMDSVWYDWVREVPSLDEQRAFSETFFTYTFELG